jgi:hypothetical protein
MQSIKLSKNRKNTQRKQQSKWIHVAPKVGAKNVHFPSIPTQFQVKLPWTQRTVGTSPIGIQCLTAYTDNLPLYIDAFYQIYNWSIIKQIDFEFSAINLDTVPYDIVLGVVPYYQAATITLDQLKETNNSVVKTLGLSTGQGRSVIKKSFNVAHYLGVNSTTRQLWLNVGDARASTPMDTGHPAVVFKAGPITTGAVSGITVTTKITFHIEFFELQLPAISTLKAQGKIEAEKEDAESMIDDDIYEFHSSVKSKAKQSLPVLDKPKMVRK